MKTCLYTLCYLDGSDSLGDGRLARAIKWLNFYLPLKDTLGFERISFCDNASSLESIDALDRIAQSADCSVGIWSYNTHLPKGSGKHDYPYCWRALYHLKTLFERGYEKIIMIDTDGFILSQRLASYIKLLDSGWTSFLCKSYGFPDASIYVLCKDAEPVLDEYMKIPWKDRVGCLMETSIPFTYVNDEFNCDRFGEKDMPQDPAMDYYGQARNSRILKFEGR